VQPVRIHLSRMPPLLKRMITDLLSPEHDMEIVGSGDGGEESLVAARVEGANMIITQDHGNGSDACLRAIVEGAPLTILKIERSGSIGTSINFVRRRHRLDEHDGKSLARVVRSSLEP